MRRKHSTILTAAVLTMMAAAVSASDLRPGESVLGTLAPEAAQAFSLDCAAGDAVKIKVKARGPGDHAPQIVVLAPSGERVASARGSRKLKVRFEAAETGRHEIRLAATAGSSARYAMKVKGERKRAHKARAAEIAFGAPEGAEVRFKAQGASGATMRDERDRQVDLLRRGSRYRSGVLERTGEYRIHAPGARKIKVKVDYPDARDAVVAASPGSPYDAPPAGHVPAGGGEADDPAGDPQDDDDGDAPAEGEVTGPPAGTAGGGGDGTVPPPAMAADHHYLVGLLSAEEDVDVRKARIEDGDLERPAHEVAAELRERFDDPLAHDLADAVEAGGAAWIPAAGRSWLLDVLAASRRAGRALERMAAIDEPLAASALATDPALGEGIAALAAAVAETEAAVARALEADLARGLSGEIAGPAVPEVSPPSREVHAGIAALDAAVANGLLVRAREGHRAPREALAILTAAYAGALAASPDLDPGPAATRAMLEQRQGELAALEDEHGDLALAVAPVEAPPAMEDYEILVRALGASGYAVDWRAEGAELETAVEEDGLRLLVRGHRDERQITVRGERAGRERVVEIRIRPLEPAPGEGGDEEPGPDPEAPPPESPSLTGRVFDGEQPAPGIVVLVLRDEEIAAEAVTDHDGRFAIDVLPEGEYVLRIGPFELPFTMLDVLDLGPIHL